MSWFGCCQLNLSEVWGIVCGCTNAFVRIFSRMLGGMSIGDVLVGSRFVYPLTLPGVIGQQLNISSMSTTRIVGVVESSSSNAFGATNCLQLFGPERPTRLVVGFVAGATKCFVLLPTVLDTKGFALISRRQLLSMLALRCV